MKLALTALMMAGLLVAAPDDKKQTAKEAAAPAKAVDPVCGMTVDTKTADKATHNGKAYYFCSREEKQAFEKNPEKYVKTAKK